MLFCLRESSFTLQFRLPFAVAQTKRQIEALLAAAQIHPRRRFGQNFMIDANLVGLIAEAGEIRAGDVVIEVGPGTGTLTEELLERLGPDGRLVAVEIDRDLSAGLRNRFGADKRFELMEADAMAGKHGLTTQLVQQVAAAREAPIAKHEAPAVRLVANLPYNIASPLIVELLLAGVDLLAFTVQKEVAQRLRAAPTDGKEYGTLSIVVQSLADVEILRKIPPTAFWPQPAVDSALVRLRRREAAETIRERERDFGRFVSALFSMRRKTLRRALSSILAEPALPLAAAGLTGEQRPEQISPEQMRRLFAAAQMTGGSLRQGTSGPCA